MKIISKLFAVLFIAAIATGCSSSKEKDAEETANDKLGKIEVQIPEELKDNEAVVKYIEDMNVVVDEYALLIDKIYDEAGEYIGMEEEDLSMMDKMKLVSIMGEVSIESTEVLAKWGECMVRHDSIATQLTEEEAVALETVWKRFEERMEQVQDKYNDILDPKKEENEVAEATE